MKRTVMWVAAVLAAGGFLGWQPASADPPKKGMPGASLGIASLTNLRDIGGHKTRDGLVVRTKLLYRSDQLSRVSPADLKKVGALGLKNEYDLRTAGEREAAPDVLPPGVTNVWLDVMADADGAGLARISRLLQDPKAANAELGGGKVEAVFVTAYRGFVSRPGASKAFRRLFLDLGKGDHLPALVHCSSGKDRTGWAAAVLLSLLGVSEDVVLDDFLRSNDYVLPAYRKVIDAFTGAGGDPAIAAAVFGVRAEYLKASFDEVKAKYGTVERYFAEGLGIDAAGRKALRDRFLTRE